MSARNDELDRGGGSGSSRRRRTIRYEATGSAAHSRLAPLVPSHWVDCSPCAKVGSGEGDGDGDGDGDSNGDFRGDERAVDFIWSNAPRRSTRPYRDAARAYSHLPNGTNILDDKWVLARLFAQDCDARDSAGGGRASPEERGLESHCFRGPEGFASFCDRVGLRPLRSRDGAGNNDDGAGVGGHSERDFEPSTSSGRRSPQQPAYAFPDLLRPRLEGFGSPPPPPSPDNLWVVKDAQSNGAGGIWVVDPSNAGSLFPPEYRWSDSSGDAVGSAGSCGSSLISGHRYVAQRYAWPPALYGGRKFHVRVYGLLTSDGRAYVHRRCFLHVANEPFSHQPSSGRRRGKFAAASPSGTAFEPSVHITNCCANSHDEAKFAGEICADFAQMATARGGPEDTEKNPAVPLGEYFPSVSKAAAELARRAMPLLRGGETNGGFEYLGMDFILSSDSLSRLEVPDTDADGGLAVVAHCAHLLEVNAPPSQETATGLPHAEELHDEVIRDLLNLWVVPRVEEASPPRAGGWRCVYSVDDNVEEHPSLASEPIAPSRAAVLNKLRWAIVERRLAKKYEEESLRVRASLENSSDKDHPKRSQLLAFVRKSFPYFGGSKNIIFLESAGGAQVPRLVIEATRTSLANRHRRKSGSHAKTMARNTLLSILGTGPENHCIFLGPNATSLLDLLSRKYVRSGFLGKGDEIIVATENHSANIDPWLEAAERVSGRVVFWHWQRSLPLSQLESIITPKTRVVAVSHASNILGELRDVKAICDTVKQVSKGRAHVVVDGVASVAHSYPAIESSGADWYVVSCHKLFGPHLGALCGQRSAIERISVDARDFRRLASESADKDEMLYKSWEVGTINYEACAGIGYGLGEYFASLSRFASASVSSGSDHLQCDYEVKDGSQTSHECTKESSSFSLVSSKQVRLAYQRIALAEEDIISPLLDFLRQNCHVQIIEDGPGRGENLSIGRIPIVTFCHANLHSDSIAQICQDMGIICRSDTFLSGDLFRQQLEYSGVKGNVVRFSFAHYNHIDETRRVVEALRSIDGWDQSR